MTLYDPTNVFAKILRKEIPANIIEETDHTLAFYDAYPKAPVHILIIPKGAYRDIVAFCSYANDDEILDFWRTVDRVISMADLKKDGCRLINNMGANGGQEVPHFHVHLCGGKKLGPMLPAL